MGVGMNYTPAEQVNKSNATAVSRPLKKVTVPIKSLREIPKFVS